MLYHAIPCYTMLYHAIPGLGCPRGAVQQCQSVPWKPDLVSDTCEAAEAYAAMCPETWAKAHAEARGQQVHLPVTLACFLSLRPLWQHLYEKLVHEELTNTA